MDSVSFVLGISGSRNFHDYVTFCEQVQNAIKSFDCGFPTAIVSGGAQGTDTLAERWAKEHKIPTIIYKPNWRKYGKRAGPLRNTDIVAKSTHLVAFPPTSRANSGTRDAIRKAKLIKIPIFEYQVKD